jgi:hypothetical protein
LSNNLDSNESKLFSVSLLCLYCYYSFFTHNPSLCHFVPEFVSLVPNSLFEYSYTRVFVSLLSSLNTVDCRPPSLLDRSSPFIRNFNDGNMYWVSVPSPIQVSILFPSIHFNFILRWYSAPPEPPKIHKKSIMGNRMRKNLHRKKTFIQGTLLHPSLLALTATTAVAILSPHASKPVVLHSKFRH